MVCFQTKNPNLGKCLSALDWKMLIFLWPFGIFYAHLGYFMTIWYLHFVFIWSIFPVLGTVHQKNLAALVHAQVWSDRDLSATLKRTVYYFLPLSPPLPFLGEPTRFLPSCCLNQNGWTQVCQMIYFYTKNPILEALRIEHFDSFYEHSVYFVAISFILWQFDIFCGRLLYFSHFGILYQEKSGNPGWTIAVHQNERSNAS
jgi:hypothetical protein